MGQEPRDSCRENSHDKRKCLYFGKEVFVNELINTQDLTEEELQKKLKKFYISNFKKTVNQRVKIYQDKLRVKPKSIEVNESKTKWGTCSSSRNITFNYMLVMVPLELIDYVVIHELCHILHMNHDRSFWRKIGSIIPDYKKKDEQLKMYGSLMIHQS